MPSTADEVRRIAAAAVESGYGALKLGWGPLGRDLGQDEELVRAAREELGADRALMLDGGRAYTVKRASSFSIGSRSTGCTGSRKPSNPTISTAMRG